jgi:glycosyltransferase involved in cell wall biosynthesis
MISHVFLQIRIAYYILCLGRSVDLFYFFIGESLVLPAIACKIMRKPVIWMLAGSVIKIHESDRSLAAKLFVTEGKICYSLADKLVVYSSRLIQEWSLSRYKSKIAFAHEHFINFTQFANSKPFTERALVIGYFGRLSEEKGITNLVEAISLVSDQRNDIQFVLGGDGPLKDRISEFIDKNNLGRRIKMWGWIAHEELPKYLNTVRLVIIPSYTEGLPNIMLESMACGAVVLSTPVGAIPDFIKDGETGFLMEDNSPECISKNLIRVMSRRDLDMISLNAQTMVEKKFSFSSTVEQYQSVIASVIGLH